MVSGALDDAAPSSSPLSPTRRAESPLLPRRERILVRAAVPWSPSDTAASANASTDRPNSVIATRRSQSRDGWDVEATGLVALGRCGALRSVAGRVTGGVRLACRCCWFFAARGLPATGFFAIGAFGFGAARRTSWLDGWTTATGRSEACDELRDSCLVPVRAARVFFGTASAAGTEGVGAGSAGGGALVPLAGG